MGRSTCSKASHGAGGHTQSLRYRETISSKTFKLIALVLLQLKSGWSGGLAINVVGVGLSSSVYTVFELLDLLKRGGKIESPGRGLSNAVGLSP